MESVARRGPSSIPRTAHQKVHPRRRYHRVTLSEAANGSDIVGGGRREGSVGCGGRSVGVASGPHAKTTAPTQWPGTKSTEWPSTKSTENSVDWAPVWRALLRYQEWAANQLLEDCTFSDRCLTPGPPSLSTYRFTKSIPPIQQHNFSTAGTTSFPFPAPDHTNLSTSPRSSDHEKKNGGRFQGCGRLGGPSVSEIVKERRGKDKLLENYFNTRQEDRERSPPEGECLGTTRRTTRQQRHIVLRRRILQVRQIAPEHSIDVSHQDLHRYQPTASQNPSPPFNSIISQLRVQLHFHFLPPTTRTCPPLPDSQTLKIHSVGKNLP